MALAQYDSNGDGIIDENDDIFNQLLLWVDSNGDGITGEGELKHLSDFGIAGINLNYKNEPIETGTEARIGNVATFVYKNGSVGSIGELWVSVDLLDTVDKSNVNISEEIKLLPNIRSFGKIYSLHTSMVNDETGILKNLVENFIVEISKEKRKFIQWVNTAPKTVIARLCF